MTAFEDLKSQWQEQTKPETPNNGAKIILKKINFIQKKQRITNVVLSVTILILIAFFFYINAHSTTLVAFALFLMIGALLIRVLIEIFSINKLKQMDVTKDATAFKMEMIAYYKNRIRTHYIATPILVLLYAIGFIILLPFFKESLSYGFYTYIWVSSIFILFILALFIGKQIKKELSQLKKIND